MFRLPLALSALSLSLVAAPAHAGAGNFTLVNGTGADIASLSIRRFGTQDWKALGSAPSAGARGPVQFSDQDCAFDLRAELAGGKTALWSGVNLCEVKGVVLNRNDSGAVWVDYE